MSFCQNDERRTQQNAFVRWREKVLSDIDLMQLLSTVFETRDYGQCFVDYSFHHRGNWRTHTFTRINANSYEFNDGQSAALERAKESWWL